VNVKLIPFRDLPEELVEFNRERVKGHLSQAIFELMETHGLTRTQFADLLDKGKSRVTQLLSGCENLSADTLADILLVFGRTPYLTLGTDPHQIRFPVDEGAKDVSQGEAVTTPMDIWLNSGPFPLTAQGAQTSTTLPALANIAVGGF
jgi:transcriptional regulator with XRE-family HTH domain